MKHHLLLILFLVCVFSRAQTTQIPDQGFEQALIDLNIDSDQTINGQVLTSDVVDVTSLELGDSQGGYYYITDLTGLDDFTSLKLLNIIGIGYWGSIDLSSLTSLEEIHLGWCLEVGGNTIQEVLLNNNPNIEIVTGVVDKIVLKGSDASISNIYMNLGRTFYAGDNNPPDIYSVCVEVTDAQQAASQQGNYANWSVNGYFSFSDVNTNCALNIDNSTLSKIKLYPNPTSAYFVIENQEELSFDQLSIYGFSGRLIKQFSRQENYSLQDLPTGIYFVKIDKWSKAFKIVKN